MNNRGFSLIEVLIASTVVIVVLLALVTMQENSSKQNKLLMQKLAILDTSRAITQNLANTALCDLMFAGSNLVDPGGLTFDASQVSAQNPYVMGLKSIPTSSSGSPLLALGADLGGMKVVSIQVLVTSKPPLASKVRVHFSQIADMIQLRDLEFNLGLASSGPLTSTKITGCGVPTAFSGLGSCPANQFVSGFKPDGTLICGVVSGSGGSTTCVTTATDGNYGGGCCPQGKSLGCSPMGGGWNCNAGNAVHICSNVLCNCAP